MSYSGPGLTTSNNSDISSFKRLEAKILAEEHDLNPNFRVSRCPSCVARFTKHVHFADAPRKHHDINEDGDVLGARFIGNEEDTDSYGDDEGDGSGEETRTRTLPKRVERLSCCGPKEKPRFHGVFR